MRRLRTLLLLCSLSCRPRLALSRRGRVDLHALAHTLSADILKKDEDLHGLDMVHSRLDVLYHAKRGSQRSKPERYDDDTAPEFARDIGASAFASWADMNDTGTGDMHNGGHKLGLLKLANSSSGSTIVQHRSCLPEPDNEYASPEEARVALAEVMRALTPRHCATGYKNKKWNCSAEGVCSVPGVFCKHGDPHELLLHELLCDRELFLPFPSALQRVPRLENIRLMSCKLTGPLPQWVFRCPLRWLDLHGNQLSGRISMPQKVHSLQLQKLTLSSNNFEGGIPPEIGAAKGLKDLALQRNRLSGPLPKELAGLTDLESLSVDSNRLRGSLPAELARLNKLLYLDVSNNGLRGPLPNLPDDLRVLNLSYSQFEDVDDLSVIPRGLYLLDMDHCNLRGDVLKTLPNLTEIMYLSAAENHLRAMVTDEKLASMEELQHLDLANNQLEGSLPAVLGTRTHLALLLMGWNQFTGVIPPSLGALPNLAVLDLRSNRLEGVLPSFSKLQHIMYLNLARNHLTGAIPSDVGTLKHLAYLVLRKNKLSGTIPSSLGNSSRLIALSLDHNMLVGQIPASLGKLSQLEVLLLSDNFLSGEIPEEIANLQTLNFFSAHSNDLSGSLPNIQLRPCKTSFFPGHGKCLASWSLITLHGNRLSCHLPASLGDVRTLRGSVAIGNKFSGPRPDWLTPHLADEIHLLQVGWFNIIALLAMSGLLIFPLFAAVVLRCNLYSVLRSFVSDLVTGTGSVAAACNRYVLISLAQLTAVNICLLVLYAVGGTYVKCGTRFGKYSIAYMDIPRNLGASGCACALLWFLHILFTCRHCAGLSSESMSFRSRAVKFWAWLAWMLVLVVFSAAPALHCILTALPADNVFRKDLGDETWLSMYLSLPLLSALLNSLLLPFIADAYSVRTGIAYETLLAVSHAIVVWIAPAAAVLVMDEHCSKRWRYYWLPCQPGVDSLDVNFSAEMQGTTVAYQILSSEEICSVPTWPSFSGGCSRQVVEIAQRFTLQQLMLEAWVLPAGHLFMWLFCELADDGKLMLPYVGLPAATFTGKDYTVRLTIWLATAAFWGPLVPVVLPILLVVVLTNALLQRIEIHHFKRVVEDEVELEHTRMSRRFQVYAVLQLIACLLLFMAENEVQQRRAMY